MNLVFYAILVFLFYRIGNFIPLPFVVADGSVSELFSQITKTGVINQQSLQRMSVFSLGIIPYITAGILIQLVRFVFADTDYGASLKDKKKLSRQTLLYTLVITLFQSIAFSRYALGENYTYYTMFVVISCLLCGSFITVWFSRIITSFGYGNGASILIMLSIIEYFSISSVDLLSGVSSGAVSHIDFMGHMIYIFILIGLVSFIEPSYRPLTLTSPSQKAMRGFDNTKKNDILPLKINNSGVLPLIFAMSFSAMLSIFIVPYIYENWKVDLSILLSLVTVLFVAFFVFFYTPYVLNTTDIANNLKKSSILCENRRPGKVTKDFIDSVVRKLNYIAVIYLGAMIIVPEFLRYFGLNVILSGVSCVILVVVILDITRRIQYSRYSYQFKSAMG